jgi:exoribonuclease R
VKAIRDWSGAMGTGLAAIREQYQVPGPFPEAVETAAAEAARRQPLQHRDRTDWAFVTLDPISSTDLDQAFHIEQSGNDWLLHYAIADVDFFVDHGGPIDAEAWKRGATIYLPDGKANLYPRILSEGAASLLPDGDRPAILFTVRVEEDGSVCLDGVERALVRSRAKLGYATVSEDDLPRGLKEIDRRIEAAEKARGASRVEPPQQELVEKDGRFELGFRPMSAIENDNASLSLACNMAVGQALLAHRTGLFRVMPEPGKSATKRLKHTAKAFGIDWPQGQALQAFERGLDPNDPREAAMMLAVRRAGERATYAPYVAGETPWHSAVAATYAHATAPLRRLADRYVCVAALAVANGDSVPPEVEAAFQELPKVMDKADSKAGQVDAAAIDLAEAVVLQCDVGKTFEAHVTDVDQRGTRLQLCDEPIVTRVDADGLEPGDEVEVRLVEVEVGRRLVRFAADSASATN